MHRAFELSIFLLNLLPCKYSTLAYVNTKFVTAMKIVQNVMTGIAGLALLMTLISFLLPSEIHVERDMLIEAPVEVVFGQVNDFRNWEDWSPWDKMAPKRTNSYEGPDSGKGQIHRWVSDHRYVRSGIQKIVESKTNQLVRIQMEFGDGEKRQSTWRFEEVEAGTRVVWAMDTEIGMSPLGKYSGLLLDGRLGAIFEQGLADMSDHIQETQRGLLAGWASESPAMADTLRAGITGL